MVTVPPLITFSVPSPPAVLLEPLTYTLPVLFQVLRENWYAPR